MLYLGLQGSGSLGTCRVQSSGGGRGGSFPPKLSSFPPKILVITYYYNVWGVSTTPTVNYTSPPKFIS